MSVRCLTAETGVNLGRGGILTTLTAVKVGNLAAVRLTILLAIPQISSQIITDGGEGGFTARGYAASFALDESNGASATFAEAPEEAKSPPGCIVRSW